jgi:hypothetical protein
MNKFAQTLSASNADIKTTRAQALAETTVLEVESFIQSLKREKLQLNNKLNQLTDLAPDNTYSLRPGSKDFDASRWVNELHETKMEIKLKTIELEVASEIRNEWFTSEDEK